MQTCDAPLLAERAGKRLTDGLAATPGVAEVRGPGLLLAAELSGGQIAPDVASRCLDGGLVLNAVTPTALRLAPPLVVTDEEIDEAVAILARALQETTTR
jgi:acetylornithine/succinyldiaminopimelate/putrescine aminotransferase